MACETNINIAVYHAVACVGTFFVMYNYDDENWSIKNIDAIIYSPINPHFFGNIGTSVTGTNASGSRRQIDFCHTFTGAPNQSM